MVDWLVVSLIEELVLRVFADVGLVDRLHVLVNAHIRIDGLALHDHGVLFHWNHQILELGQRVTLDRVVQFALYRRLRHLIQWRWLRVVIACGCGVIIVGRRWLDKGIGDFDAALGIARVTYPQVNIARGLL